MPLFSVIIPCYNSARWVRRCLDSVFAQGGNDFEVITVDDGSTDDTLAILDAYGHGIKVFSQSNQGAGVARNLAIRHAAGDYIATLDADDVWFPWTLAIYRQLIAEFNQPGIVAGKPLHFKDDAELADDTAPEPAACRHYANFYTAAADGFWFLLNGALIVRKDVLETCGGFADRNINSEDTHLFMKFGMVPDFIAVDRPKLFGYRLHGANAIFNSHLNFTGCQYCIAQEKAGHYPGGVAMRKMRRTMLSTHSRSASLACLKAGSFHQGWQLYLNTIGWNLALGRIRYLAGFPVLLAMAPLKKHG